MAGHCDSDLWLLPDGPAARITQQLGPGAQACRMDAGAMEEAAVEEAVAAHPAGEAGVAAETSDEPIKDDAIAADAPLDIQSAEAVKEDAAEKAEG